MLRAVLVWRTVILLLELPEKVRLVVESGPVEDFGDRQWCGGQQAGGMFQSDMPDKLRRGHVAQCFQFAVELHLAQGKRLFERRGIELRVIQLCLDYIDQRIEKLLLLLVARQWNRISTCLRK